MKLLFFVQMVDSHDTIRGFIPSWIRALAQEVEELTVLAQEVKYFDKVKNVRVITLGKEQGLTKWQQGIKLQQCLRKELWHQHYDAVLTHMTPLYSVLTYPFAAVKGIPIFTWYTHGHVSFMLKMAHLVSKKCFTANESSFRLPSTKKIILGHGIDFDHFCYHSNHITSHQGPLRFITASRISPVKNIDVLLKALQKISGDWTLDIAGQAPMESQKKYEDEVKHLATQLKRQVTWHGPVSYSNMPSFLLKGDVFVNLSSTRSVDKNVLEAIASGLSVVTSNEAFMDLLEGVKERTWISELSVGAVKDKIEQLIKTKRDLLQQDQEKLFEIVSQEHDLKIFAKKIVFEMERNL